MIEPLPEKKKTWSLFWYEHSTTSPKSDENLTELENEEELVHSGRASKRDMQKIRMPKSATAIDDTERNPNAAAFEGSH